MLRPAQYWPVNSICLLTGDLTTLRSYYKSCARQWIQVRMLHVKDKDKVYK